MFAFGQQLAVALTEADRRLQLMAWMAGGSFSRRRCRCRPSLPGYW